MSPKKANLALGLDISTNSVKVAEISIGKGEPVLTNLGIVHIPDGVIRDGEVEDGESVRGHCGGSVDVRIIGVSGARPGVVTPPSRTVRVESVHEAVPASEINQVFLFVFRVRADGRRRPDGVSCVICPERLSIFSVNGVKESVGGAYVNPAVVGRRGG